MTSYQADDAARTPVRLGRYQLLGRLAIGGMAEIHLARLDGEAGFEKIVVIKRLLPELVASPAYVAMFLDEGKLVARLDHPNICEVYELGRDGAEYFIAMPYLDGVPATELISRARDPDRIAQLRVATGIIVQACGGLHHAHELRGADGAALGLVHRDVSPSNVFVTTAGVVKVLDFGVAKVRGASETEVGTIKGKSQYMAPEQVLGEELDRRCDVFALGIVLFELATHQRLFKRASEYLEARAILEDAIPRADAVDPAVPVALADVIEKALARDRTARYANANELARAIEVAMAPHGIAGAAAIASALTEHHADELTAQRTRQARVLGTAATTIASATIARRSWPRIALIGGPLIVAAIVIGVIFGRSAGHDAPAPAVEPSRAPVPIVTPPPPAPLGAPPVAPSEVAMPDDSVAHRRYGRLSIDSTPYATIYLDGHSLGVTPIVHRSIEVGHHELRAVAADGRSRVIAVDILGGRDAAPIRLTWE